MFVCSGNYKVKVISANVYSYEGDIVLVLKKHI
jgi:hypothetical protein